MIILTDNYFPRLKLALANTEACCRIMAYVINFHFYKHFYASTWVFDRLIHLHQNRAVVQVLLDSSPDYSHNHRANFFTAKRLAEAGIQTRMLVGRKPQHAKLIICDDRVAFLGSHNLTEGSLTSRHELSLELTDPFSVRELTRFFDSFWKTELSAPWERRTWQKAKTKASPFQTATTV